MAAAKKIEDRLLELETIANNMENGELTIEEMVKEYAKGVKLSNTIKKSINDIELKIEEISID